MLDVERWALPSVFRLLTSGTCAFGYFPSQKASIKVSHWPCEEDAKQEDDFQAAAGRIWRLNRRHCRVARDSPARRSANRQCADDRDLLGDRAAHRGIRTTRRDTRRLWGTNSFEAFP